MHAALLSLRLFKRSCQRCMVEQLHHDSWLSNSVASCTAKRMYKCNVKTQAAKPMLPAYADSKSPLLVQKMMQEDFMLIEDFVCEEEERQLLKEIEPYMARLRYEYSHWDDAINGYRETEKSSWNPANTHIICRLKEKAFTSVGKPTDFVHVLDLEKGGVIKPHKDSIRFCGDTIAGISLLSPSVMRLVAMDDKETSVDVLLKPRSLYIMRNSARYNYTHEILHNDHSYFKGNHVEKDRRISVICRNNPTDDCKS